MQTMTSLDTMTSSQQLVTLFRDIRTEADSVSQFVEGVTKNVQNGRCNTSKGISFLEVKHQMLHSYLLNLVHLMKTKVSGASIQASPDIERLVELRTVLEKLRPIEHKLKYQLDKLVQMAVQGSLAPDDPLNFKPNPQALVSKLNDDQEGEESENDGSDSDNEERDGHKTGVYVPPRIQPMYYDGDVDAKSKREERVEKARKRVLHSSIIRELRDEYSEAPDEVQHDSLMSSNTKLKKQLTERNAYEEDNFVRLGLSKKTKNDIKSMRQRSGQSNLDKLTNFGVDWQTLDKNYDPDSNERPKGTKRKSSGGKKGKKGKGRKRAKFGF